MDLTQFADINIWTIVKIGILIFLLVYTVFSFVVVKQTRLMTETLDVDFDRAINTAARLLFLASISVLILSLIFI